VVCGKNRVLVCSNRRSAMACHEDCIGSAAEIPGSAWSAFAVKKGFPVPPRLDVPTAKTVRHRRRGCPSWAVGDESDVPLCCIDNVCFSPPVAQGIGIATVEEP